MTDTYNEETNESSVTKQQPFSPTDAVSAEQPMAENKTECEAKPEQTEQLKPEDKNESKVKSGQNDQSKPDNSDKTKSPQTAEQNVKKVKKTDKKKEKKDVKLNKAALVSAIISGLLLLFWMYVVIPVPDDSICPNLTIKIRRFLDPYTKYNERPNCIYGRQYD